MWYIQIYGQYALSQHRIREKNCKVYQTGWIKAIASRKEQTKQGVSKNCDRFFSTCKNYLVYIAYYGYQRPHLCSQAAIICFVTAGAEQSFVLLDCLTSQTTTLVNRGIYAWLQPLLLMSVVVCDTDRFAPESGRSKTEWRPPSTVNCNILNFIKSIIKKIMRKQVVKQ